MTSRPAATPDSGRRRQEVSRSRFPALSAAGYRASSSTADPCSRTTKSSETRSRPRAPTARSLLLLPASPPTRLRRRSSHADHPAPRQRLQSRLLVPEPGPRRGGRRLRLAVSRPAANHRPQAGPGPHSRRPHPAALHALPLAAAVRSSLTAATNYPTNYSSPCAPAPWAPPPPPGTSGSSPRKMLSPW